MNISRRMYLAFSSGALVTASGVVSLTSAWAHGDKQHAAKDVVFEQKPWGIAAKGKPTKTIAVGMGDDMKFKPAAMNFRLGDRVLFKIKNNGKIMHEFVIGTVAENAIHAEQMIKFPNMEHDEAYMAHVPPGKTMELFWEFNRKGQFEFACLIAGHYQAGMKGVISVT